MTNQSRRAQGASAIRGWFGVVRRQGWIVLVCLVLTGVAANVIAEREDTTYSASARLLVRSYDPARSLPGVVQNFGDPTRTRATDLQLIRQAPVARAVERQLETGKATGVLLSMISTNASGDSDIITVTATSPKPFEAVAIANSFADNYVRYRRVTNRRRFEEPVRLARINLAKARTRDDPESIVQALRDQLDRLRLLASLETADAQVVAHAGPDTIAANKPEVNRATIAGALLGLLVGLLLALLRERLDDRVRREEDLEEALPGVRIVGRIPRLRGGRSSESGRRAFDDLRLTLDVLTPQHQSRSLLVSSAGEGEGKSTTAANLALSYALSGDPASVLLIDADLRHPDLSARLGGTDGVVSQNGSGLSRVLEGDANVESEVSSRTATRRMRGRGPRVTTEGSFPMLTAGESKSDTQTLINAESASSLLAGAAQQARTVIIDGPPLGLTAEMLPVARYVSGVLLVVRINRTRGRELQVLRERLQAADVRPLGVVLVGTARDRSSY